MRHFILREEDHVLRNLSKLQVTAEKCNRMNLTVPNCKCSNGPLISCMFGKEINNQFFLNKLRNKSGPG